MNKIVQSAKDRISPKTTGKKWKVVRNISGIISVVGGCVLIAPVSIPVATLSWITWITTVSGVIAGRAHLDKSKK